MKAQFIELDIILKINSKPWIVDKLNPSVPIMKMELYEFNLFKSGAYKSHGNKLNFNGKTFWVSTEFMNKLKIKSKINKTDISNLGISMQEFMNKDIIKDIPFELNMEIFKPIINSNDDIYIICSKNSKINYEFQLGKLEEKMSEIGLIIKDFYHISETFYNRNEDEISHNKSKLILQHLVGFKSDGNSFTTENIKKYNEIVFYDDNLKSIEFCKDVNSLLDSMLSNSNENIKLSIKDRIKNNDILLIIREWTYNRSNKYKEYQINLHYSSIIKTFEKFNYGNKNKI